MREKAVTLLGVLMLGLLSPIADVCGVELPKWLRFGLFHAFVIALIFVLLAIATAYVTPFTQRIRWFKKLSVRQTTVAVIIFGAIIGAIMAPIVWNAIRPDDIDIAHAIDPNGTVDAPTASAVSPGDSETPKEVAPGDRIVDMGDPVVTKVDQPRTDRAAVVIRRGETFTFLMAPLIPDPNQKPADSNDLKFYFFARTAAAAEDNMQYGEAILTNRSPRKMHLEILGHIDYWKDNGEPARIGMPVEWNPNDLNEYTGESSIDLEPFETKKGRLVLFLGKPEEYGLSKWFLDAGENVYFDVFDTVTGKRAAFKGMTGYPHSQIPSPLPSYKRLLQPDFPLPAIEPQSAATLDSLDVLIRTRDRAYTAGEMRLSAMIKNNSSARMELYFSLLLCDKPNGKAWQAHDGLVYVGEAKDSPGVNTVIVDPGATVEGSLKFDIADLAAAKPKGWQTTDMPNENLLEINDRVSGKTIWCAVRSGYPPGTDMRPFQITKKLRANSSNFSNGPSNDKE